MPGVLLGLLALVVHRTCCAVFCLHPREHLLLLIHGAGPGWMVSHTLNYDHCWWIREEVKIFAMSRCSDLGAMKIQPWAQ